MLANLWFHLSSDAGVNFLKTSVLVDILIVVNVVTYPRDLFVRRDEQFMESRCYSTLADGTFIVLDTTVLR